MPCQSNVKSSSYKIPIRGHIAFCEVPILYDNVWFCRILLWKKQTVTQEQEYQEYIDVQIYLKKSIYYYIYNKLFRLDKIKH